MFVQQPDTATEPQYKYISAEDFEEYGRWYAPHVAAFNPIPSGPLYHYTTGNSVIDIIRSGELRATQVACLNDSSELLYPIELLREKVDIMSKSPISLELGFLLKEIEDGRSATAIDTEGRFLACFSEDGTTSVSGAHTAAAKADMQSDSTHCIFGITNHRRQYWTR